MAQQKRQRRFGKNTSDTSVHTDKHKNIRSEAIALWNKVDKV